MQNDLSYQIELSVPRHTLATVFVRTLSFRYDTPRCMYASIHLLKYFCSLKHIFLRIRSYLLVLFAASFPPRIHGPNVINATINQTIELNITAEHNSSDYFVFTVWNFPNVEIVANTSQYLVIRWQPKSTQTVSYHIASSIETV